jgi:hypothetical protein
LLVYHPFPGVSEASCRNSFYESWLSEMAQILIEKGARYDIMCSFIGQTKRYFVQTVARHSAQRHS